MYLFCLSGHTRCSLGHSYQLFAVFTQPARNMLWKRSNVMEHFMVHTLQHAGLLDATRCTRAGLTLCLDLFLL